MIPKKNNCNELVYGIIFLHRSLFTRVVLLDVYDNNCTICYLGEFEVGVHIADVSYFVQPDTPLDEVAASRATSVYLVQMVSNFINQVRWSVYYVALSGDLHIISILFTH